MKTKKFYALCLFLFTFSVVFGGFSAQQTGSGSGTNVPLVKFKEWKVGRSDKGTDKDNTVHISFITSTETTCWFSASVGYVGGSQPKNTSPIDPKTVAWDVIGASHKMKLDKSSVKKNWTGKDPSTFDTGTSFNVVAKLIVPAHKKYGCTQPLDAKRKDRKPVHREGKKMAFKIKFTANTKAGGKVEKLLSLIADDKDQIRQEYVDLNRPIPTREDNKAKLTKWAGENTYDFGHYKMMLDHGLSGYFQAWIDAMNKDYRKGKKDAKGNPLSTLKKSDFLLNSGYRNPHHNHHHSGSTGLSSHMYGYALDVNGRDLDGKSGVDKQKMVDAAYAAKPKARFSQPYKNKTHVHADWAPNTPVLWPKRKKTADDPPSFKLPTQTTTQAGRFAPSLALDAATYQPGDTVTAVISSDQPMFGSYLYVGSLQAGWRRGSSRKTTYSITLRYTFPDNAAGTYTFSARAFPWKGNSYGTSVYSNEQTVTVTTSGSTTSDPTRSLSPANSSYTASAGDSHTANFTTSAPYSSVYWYVKKPGDTSALGTNVEIDYGDGSKTTADLSYTFPSSVSGTYKITAYVYPQSGSVYQESYTVDVSTTSTTTTTTTTTTPTAQITLDKTAYKRGDTVTATVTTTPAYYGMYLYVKPPGDTTYRGKQIKWYWSGGKSTRQNMSYTIPTDAATGDYKFTAYIFPHVNGTYGTGYEVSKNATVSTTTTTTTTPSTPTQTPTFSPTVSGVSATYSKGDWMAATVSTGAASLYGVYLFVYPPGSNTPTKLWHQGDNRGKSTSLSMKTKFTQTGTWRLYFYAYPFKGNTYGTPILVSKTVTVQ